MSNNQGTVRGIFNARQSAADYQIAELAVFKLTTQADSDNCICFGGRIWG